MERLIAAGIFLMMLGFFAVLAGVLLSAGKGSDAQVKGGGVIFLGPIPLVFGSDRQTAVTAAVIGLALMAAYWLLFMRG